MKQTSFLLILSSMFILSACQKYGQGDPSPTEGGVKTMQGPSDGGGGDTCNDKMIESYQVDITLLDEFKDLIQPVLDKVTLNGDGKTNTNPFILTAKFKNWYFIDCKLQNIPPERKGLYLESYQTAIHTAREIFIDRNSYKKMEKIEKAKLLLHEMIMGFYLIKYLSLDEICKISNSCTGDFTVAGKWKMFKPEIFRPLNEEDHQKIRKVTAWLWAQKDVLDPSSFSEILKSNDFDKRFELVSADASTGSKEIEVDIKTLLRTFKKYQWTNTFPNHCQFDNITNISLSTCSSEVLADIRDYSLSETAKIRQLYLKIKITRNSDHKILVQEFSYPLSNDSQKIKLSVAKLGSVLHGATFAMTGNWPSHFGVPAVEGLKSQMLFFILNFNNPENPEIYQIYFQNYIWHHFEDVITQREGFNYKETYGYLSLLPDESETLFIENELPFTIKMLMQVKNFIQSKLISKEK